MPKIYKRNCNYCGKYYEGTGKKYCSKACFGKSMRGIKTKEATKKKMSEALKGNDNAKGREVSEETKKKLSKIAKEQWGNPSSRIRKLQGIKDYWKSDKGKELRDEMSQRAKAMWCNGKLSSDRFPHGENHWNYNPDREEGYRRGQYFSKNQRKRLLKDECEWCGSKENLQLDHKIAIMNGGTSDDSNAQTLCGRCNNLKRDIIDFRGKDK